jgi:diguanylate cyclase (GGDEF)-like protein
VAVRQLTDAMRVGGRKAVVSVRAWQLWTLTPLLRWYLAVVTALPLLVIPFAAAETQWRLSQAVIFIALLVCGAVALESTRVVSEAHGTVIRDLQTVWYLAIAVTLPPVYALLAPVPLTAYRLWRMRRGYVYRRVFSSATISLAYGCACLVFHAVPPRVAGSVPGTASHALIWTGVVACCGALAWIVNNGLLLVAIGLADPEARIRNMFGNREALTFDLTELSLAVSLSLVIAINPVLMALGLPTIVLYRRYLMSAQLVMQARLDAKTGLLNAGTWHHEAEVELHRALRADSPLALALVVIDHFNDVNETAGQAVRDQLLRDIAVIIKDQLPDQDLIGRFGSEQFAILLPRTGRNEAQRISERLRDHVAGEPIAIESGSHAGYVFRMTVSIGVAVMNQSRRALAELIGAADTALDEARSTGWSKVYVLPDSSGEGETS